MKRRVAFSATTLAFALAHSVSATNITEDHFVDPTGWTAGSPNTTTAQWGETPDTLPPITTDLSFSSNPTLPSPTLAEVAPGFIAGSGGLYASDGNYQAVATISNPDAVPGAAGTRVLIQTAATLNPDFTTNILATNFTAPDGTPLAATLLNRSSLFFATALPTSFGPADYEELSQEYLLPGYDGAFKITLDIPVHTSFAGLRVDTAVVPEPAMTGDFNYDGVVNAIDIDLLSDAIRANSSADLYDVSEDGAVSMVDLTYEVQTILHTDFGDSDADGDVDLNDLGNLASNFEIAGRNKWSQGNFDSDNDVDLNDLGTLATNFGAGPARAFAEFETLVPEPAGGAMLATAGALALLRRRQCAAPR